MTGFCYDPNSMEAQTARAIMQSGGEAAITTADGVTKLTTLGSDTELDLTAHNAWLFSPDEADSGTVGMGTGNATDSSGAVVVYTGDGGSTGLIGISTGHAATGDTGGIGLQTGNSDNGNSGGITLATGTADGTRGSIVLDGAMIKRGSGQWFADPGVGFDIECSNEDTTGSAGASAAGLYLQAGIAVTLGKGGDAWVQAGDGGSTGGDGGLAGIQGGQSTCAGATGGELHLVGGQAGATDASGGSVLIVSGQGQGTGSSGNITIRTGNVDSGTRGDISLDAWHVVLLNLPSSDPHVVNVMYQDAADGHRLKVSQG